MDKRQIKVSDIASALEKEGMLVRAVPGAGDAAVTAVTYNSKEVSEGAAFVCKGAHFREQYLRDAIGAGASCYISEKE